MKYVIRLMFVLIALIHGIPGEAQDMVASANMIIEDGRYFHPELGVGLVKVTIIDCFPSSDTYHLVILDEGGRLQSYKASAPEFKHGDWFNAKKNLVVDAYAESEGDLLQFAFPPEIIDFHLNKDIPPNFFDKYRNVASSTAK